MAEQRRGFAFNNPDETSDYLAPRWGLLVHADELRYDEMWGNALSSEADGSTITDDQLNDYGRVAIQHLERELNIDILPRRVRYKNAPNDSGIISPRTDVDDSDFFSRMNRKQKTALYIEEQGYAFKVIPARKEFRIKLRRRPVVDLLSAKLIDPYYGNTVIDLMPYRIVKSGLTGVCYFRPRNMYQTSNTFNLFFQNLYDPYQRDIQRIFLIDYESGYQNCMDVPDDLRMIAKKLAACTLMNIFGDGKTAAIASRSVSLNSVSESISTTMSATSAMFGARIIQYQKEIKEWFSQNRSKYSRTNIGVL
jgi:hypothetical protein